MRTASARVDRVRRALVIILWLFLFWLGLMTAVWVGVRWMLHSTRQSLLDGARPGMTRSQVEQRLGRPSHVAHSLDELFTSGWKPVPTRPVDYEVLEYNRFVWRVYVYMGRDGKVVYVQLART